MPFGLFVDPNQAVQATQASTNLAQSAALGNAPSAAAEQQKIGLNQAMQQQAALANSTRGSFGLAGAQQRAQSAGAQMTQQAVDQAAMQRAQEQAQARGQFLQAQQSQAGLQQNAAMQNAAVSGKLLQAGVGAAGGLLSMSDARAKNVQPGVGPGLASSFLDSLKPSAYSYKNPADAPNPTAAHGTNLGVLAQDVERSPAGDAIVQPGPDGAKRLDIHALVGAMAAGVGHLHKQQQDHEARLTALERAAHRG